MKNIFNRVIYFIGLVAIVYTMLMVALYISVLIYGKFFFHG